MRKFVIGAVALGMWLSSVFAAYQPSMKEEKVVDAAWSALIQIVETKHDGNFELLLGILKSFQPRVAGDERKSWILDTLINLTMDKMGMMMDDTMMKEEMMDNKMMGGTHKTFDVSGTNFAFSMDSISVHEGDTVTINFESTEGFHDRVLDEFDAATAQVRAGDGVTSVTFVADMPWTFEYYCSVGSHRAQGMVGNLIIEAKIMNDPHNDTMMDDSMIDKNMTLLPLGNVTDKNPLVRWIQFSGNESGWASIQLDEDGNTHVYAEFQNLPNPGPDNFYEGWIVRQTGWFNFYSTGEAEFKDGKWINEYTHPWDVLDHKFYVLTIEPRDNDPAPAEHVVEGNGR